MDRRLGFIGCGQMARALASGFVKAGKTTPAHLVASDVSPAARKAMEAEVGCKTTGENVDVTRGSDVIFLATKPQILDAVLDEIAPASRQNHLFVSIAAGYTTAKLTARLGAEARVIRVMPNTPCLVGASASGFAKGGAATDSDAELVTDLFSAVGVAFALPEASLDAVTGLSGSGPAYVYQFLEALSDGGVKMGLPRDVATKLAAQTLFGAAKMALETGLHPGILKDMVTSPGGTTIAGLAVLEHHAVRGAIIEAVEAATLRSRELGKA